ncbi:hypothetical protein DSM112329_04622 [Paraconexibacter sp. AEG42_29]|uniref:Class I SAM-dependent methyltransferase n=1 Tax=Paraconexibacter sp. AEG42_29 TaxID=2997339 RepID=A0AAU7B2A1_9ACTN
MPTVAGANVARNANGDRARHRRWAPAREAAWSLLARHVPRGARVAVVGAGNGDTLPLRRIAARAQALELIDLDDGALARARRRVAFGDRSRVRTRVADITGGQADAAIRAALGERPSAAGAAADVDLGTHDVVIADCLYTQLLYPALADSGRLDGLAIDRALLQSGQGVTNAAVARLHAAAPDGIVVHLHDLLGWWDGQRQPFALDDVLACAEQDGPDAALRLALKGSLPFGCDPRAASARLGAPVTETAFWRWPFGGGVDYLVCATVARARP